MNLFEIAWCYVDDKGKIYTKHGYADIYISSIMASSEEDALKELKEQEKFKVIPEILEITKR